MKSYKYSKSKRSIRKGILVPKRTNIIEDFELAFRKFNREFTNIIEKLLVGLWHSLG